MPKISELLANDRLPSGDSPTSSDALAMYDASQDKTVGVEPTRIGGETGYDHIVTSLSELQNLFSGGLSEGDSVFISSEGAPYRTTQWLDIDVSGVQVFGSKGTFDIKPADGANVGGFRIAFNAGSEIVDVRLINISYEGNSANQTADALDFVDIYDAKDCVIYDCYIRDTSPRDEHHTGGSGVTCRPESEGVVVQDCRIHDFGDRGVQLAGKDHQVYNCDFQAGFDRAVAFNIKEPRAPSGTIKNANHCIVADNFIDGLSEGSGIGAPNTSCDYHMVIGNHIRGKFKGGVLANDGVPSHWLVANNLIRHQSNDGTQGRSGIEVGDNSVVIGNRLYEEDGIINEWDEGVEINGSGVLCNSNLITMNHTADQGGIVCQSGAGVKGVSITGNFIYNQAGTGIDMAVQGIIKGNILRWCPIGIVIRSATPNNANKIEGNFFRQIQTKGILIDTGSQKNTIINNTIFASGGASSFIDARGPSPNSGIVLVLGNYDAVPLGNNFNNGVPNTMTNNFPKEYAYSTVATFSGGSTTTFNTGITSQNADLRVWSTPANDPGNDHGYKIDKVWFDTSSGTYKIQVTETENAGGGDAFVAVDRMER